MFHNTYSTAQPFYILITKICIFILHMNSITRNDTDLESFGKLLSKRKGLFAFKMLLFSSFSELFISTGRTEVYQLEELNWFLQEKRVSNNVCSLRQALSR